MPDQAPQTLDELLDSDALYEKDGYGGYRVDKDYAKAALTALMERVIGEPVVPLMPRAPGTKESWDAYLQARAKMILQDEQRKRLGELL